MAFVLEDRVVETANNPGQGDFELLGAVENSWTFVTGIGDGNTTRYLAVGAEGAEIGIAQVQAGSPDRLLRPGTVKNFDGTTTPVNFSGTVTVACVASVEDVLWLGENGDLPARGGRDLGTSGDPWRNLFLSGTATAKSGASIGGGATPLVLDRGVSSFNVNVEYRLNDGSVYAGNIDGTGFAIGGGSDLRQPSNRWALFEKSLAQFNVMPQVGSTPIIERGDNSNGRYVKFGDGTMLCLGTISGTYAVNTAAGALYRSDNINVTFPAEFSSTTNLVTAVDVNGNNGANTAYATRGDPASTTQLSIRLVSPISAGGAVVSIRWLAMGGWS